VYTWVRDPAHFEGLFRFEAAVAAPNPSYLSAELCPLVRPLSVCADLVEGGRASHFHLRHAQEDARMLQPQVVDRIHELARHGHGRKRIARELGLSRNTVRRYLDGAPAGFQEATYPSKRLGGCGGAQ
jgi:hypothetical protein